MRLNYMPRKSPLFMRLAPLTVLLVLLLLSACATPPAPPPNLLVRSAQMPPLPGYARQPPMPPECLPTCLSALNKEREYWLTLLTTPTLPVHPVSADTPKPATN